MHEMSYIVKLVNTALDSLKDMDGGKVKELFVQVGAMTGLEPYYLKKYYPEAVRGTLLEGSGLQVELIPVEACCQDCGLVYQPTRDYGYGCPSCGSGQGRVVHGREFVLDHIVLEMDGRTNESSGC